MEELRLETTSKFEDLSKKIAQNTNICLVLNEEIDVLNFMMNKIGRSQNIIESKIERLFVLCNIAHLLIQIWKEMIISFYHEFMIFNNNNDFFKNKLVFISEKKMS